MEEESVLEAVELAELTKFWYVPSFCLTSVCAVVRGIFRPIFFGSSISITFGNSSRFFLPLFCFGM